MHFVAWLQAKYVQLETEAGQGPDVSPVLRIFRILWDSVRSIQPGCPQCSPSVWHTVTAPQTFPPDPGPHERPLPVRRQWGSQGHHGSLSGFQCSIGAYGWCGLSWRMTHKLKQQAQGYFALLFHPWKQYFTITAEHVFACEPRIAPSRAVGRSSTMVAAGWCQQPAIKGWYRCKTLTLTAA